MEYKATQKGAILPIQLNAVLKAARPTTRPKGRNLRWTIIGVLTLLAMTNYLDRGNLSVAAPQIMEEMHISNTLMGVILSAFVWPYALMNLPSGWAVDRFGAKLMLTLAAGLWSLVAVLTGFARHVEMFIGLRIALGFSEAPLFPAALKATNAWFPDHEKAAATSVYIAATQLGLAIAPPAATLLMAAFGWPAMFIIMGAFGFVAMVGWIVIYREPNKHPWLHPNELAYIRSGQEHGDAGDVKSDHVSMRDWISLFKYPTTWIMITAGFSLQYVFWFYISWLPTYLQKAQGFTLTHAGFLAAVPYLAGGIAVLLGGKLSDTLIVRGMDAFKARRYVIAGASVLTAITMFATALSTGPVLAVVLLTLGMFTYSLASANYWAIATNAVSTSRYVASIGSIQNFGGFIGGACAPIITGLLVDRFGGFIPALILAGGLALLSAFLYAVVLRKRLPV